MSTIIRDDGTPFVTHAYRELIEFGKKSQVVQRLRELASQQGQFVQLFRRHFGELEAVFSKESGYLLGESIKNYFPRMKNLIFVETSRDEHRFLLVIIKEGHVFMDALLSLSELKAELLPLTGVTQRFQIILSGRLPECITDFKQGFFPNAMVDTIEYIKEPLLPHLPMHKHVKLTPLAMTLRAKKLGNNGKAAASVLLAFMGMASIGLSLYSYYHNKAPKPRYPEYQAALNSPAPTQIIATLAQLVERSYFAPGWQATEVIQQAQHYQIKLIADRGKLETLDTWADQKGYQLAINTQGALLNLAPNTPSRQPITHIYPIGKITTQLMDKANRLFDSPDISIDKLVMHAHSREAQITITAQAITTQQLLYLGEQLTKLPLVLRKTQLSITPSALLNIELKLSAWGT